MIGNIAARRYAQALFSLGKKAGAGELDAYGKDLAALSGLLSANPMLKRVLKNPIFGVKEKRALIDSLLDKIGASAVVRRFCALLADKERLGILAEIQAVFSTLLDVEQGVVRGGLVTAVSLDGKKQTTIKSQLEKQTGKKLVLEYAVDPSILGGVVLKVGDTVLDASLRAQLNILKENIKRGE